MSSIDTPLARLRDGLWHSLDELRENADESFFSFAQQCAHLLSDSIQFESDGNRIRWKTPQPLLTSEMTSAGIHFCAREFEGSTSDAVRAHNMGAEFVIAAAETQLGGRGRRGQVWFSPVARNLYFSVRCKVGAGVAFPRRLSLVAGIALAEALNRFGVKGVAVKWPNDLYLHDRKLGGILVELTTKAGGGFDVVVGVGINVNMADYSVDLGQPWISISDLFGNQDRGLLMQALFDGLLPAMSTACAGDEEKVIQDWDDYDLLSGRGVVARLRDGRSVAGIGAGIDGDGCFIMETDEGVVEFDSADASLRLL